MLGNSPNALLHSVFCCFSGSSKYYSAILSQWELTAIHNGIFFPVNCHSPALSLQCQMQVSCNMKLKDATCRSIYVAYSLSGAWASAPCTCRWNTTHSYLSFAVSHLSLMQVMAFWKETQQLSSRWATGLTRWAFTFLETNVLIIKS